MIYCDVFKPGKEPGVSDKSHKSLILSKVVLTVRLVACWNPTQVQVLNSLSYNPAWTMDNLVRKEANVPNGKNLCHKFWDKITFMYKTAVTQTPLYLKTPQYFTRFQFSILQIDKNYDTNCVFWYIFDNRYQQNYIRNIFFSKIQKNYLLILFR